MPKPEPKHVTLEFEYNCKLILPQQTAAKIVGLLEEAEGLIDGWRDEDTKITPTIKFTLMPIDNEKINGIKKAKLAGISYKEYLEIKEEKVDEINQ